MTWRHLIVAGIISVGGAGVAWAEGEHEGHAHDHGAVVDTAAPTAAGEQTLTGEVVDVFCYLSHPEHGQGADHAGCAKKCIQGGLPVAIKVGDQLYLATMNNHESANKALGDLAAQRVTVTGTVMERDGQRLIAISSIQKAE